MKFTLIESIEQFDLQGAVIDALYTMFSGQFYLNNFGENSSITLHNMDCTKNFEIIIKKGCIIVQENGKTIRTFKNATVSSAKRAVLLIKKKMSNRITEQLNSPQSGTRVFAMTDLFDKQLEHLGLSDSELSIIEEKIQENPQIGRVVEGAGRARKFRISFDDNNGKSFGERVVYFDLISSEIVLLLMVFSKKEKKNLDSDDKKYLRETIRIAKEKFKNVRKK